jgi:Ser/Thr protein kinase RdoA (MazF antagonist)
VAGGDGRDLFRGQSVERLIFDAENDEEIQAIIELFCRETLGVPVRGTLFRRTSVGVVFGVELEDGRRVVVKAHQPRQSSEFLRVVYETQTRLAQLRFPCPRPLAEPAPLGNGFATVEEWIEDGVFVDAHDPTIRAAMGQALARLIELTRPLGQPPGLRNAWSLWEGDDLWPADAHSPIFDFRATADGAEWIDSIACDAKAGIPAGGEELIMHSDWSSKHFRFDAAGEITVIYDWDSLALETEVQALGTAAATFTANFDLDVFLAPTPNEVASFIEDYSAARGAPLSIDDVRAAHAVAGYLVAYTARCEHALGKRGDFTQALAQSGRAYLAPSL